MYSFLSRYGQAIALGVGALITVVFFVIVGANSSTLATLDGESLKKYNERLSQESFFNFGLTATYFLVFACAIAAVVFGVLGVVKDPKGSLKGLIGIGVLLVLFAIGYAMAGTDPASVVETIERINAGTFAEDGSATINTVTEGRSKFISGALSTTLLLGVVSFIGLLAFEVWNLFR